MKFFFNITYMGQFNDDSQLARSSLQKSAILIDEEDDCGDSVARQLWKGLMVVLPMLLLAIMYVLSCLFDALQTAKIDDRFFLHFGLSVLVSLPLLAVFEVVHEIIHALFYPRTARKEIYRWSEKDAWFMYSTAPLEKGRFIVMSLAPTLVLGVLPFLGFVLCRHSDNIPICMILALLSLGGLIGGIGDCFNVYVVLNYLPNKCTIFTSGLHGYYIPERDKGHADSPKSKDLFFCALSFLALGLAFVDTVSPIGYIGLVAALVVFSFADDAACRILRWVTFVIIVAFFFGSLPSIIILV